jgi:FlaA1/EpsC-like NDP-sugar epimerase
MNLTKVLYQSLGRDAIEIHPAAVDESLGSLSALVTGGGGSVGSELARGLASAGAAQIYLLDTSESNLFWIHRELEKQVNCPSSVSAVIGSICDPLLLEQLFAEGEFDLVVHAAAYKHVGLVSKNPLAAIHANIIGTRNLLEAASSAGVDRFLSISSDKAVEPVSVMGMTKRAAERTVAGLAGPVRAASIRFGNVIGSSGSVLPIFENDWVKFGRIEVRDVDAKRFFLTPYECRGLLLVAAGMIEGGEVFALQTGEPVRILDLARRFLVARGCANPDACIDITSPLPEEKRDEILWAGQAPDRTTHPNIFRLREPAPDASQLKAAFQMLEQACEDRDEQVAMSLVRQIAES